MRAVALAILIATASLRYAIRAEEMPLGTRRVHLMIVGACFVCIIMGW